MVRPCWHFVFVTPFMGANMSELFNPVVPKPQHISESQFHSLIVAGLARVASKIGRGNLADRMGRTTRALDKVFAGSTPDAKALFDALAADATVLDELAAAYGFQLVPIAREHEPDLSLAAGLCDGASELMKANTDGNRDHRETMKVAEILRPHIGPAMAIVRQADKIRGVAA